VQRKRGKEPFQLLPSTKIAWDSNSMQNMDQLNAFHGKVQMLKTTKNNVDSKQWQQHIVQYSRSYSSDNMLCLITYLNSECESATFRSRKTTIDISGHKIFLSVYYLSVHKIFILGRSFLQLNNFTISNE